MTPHEALVKNIEEIQVRLGEHEHLLNRLREGDEEVIDCPSIDCPLRRLFKQILMEAIEVLEESRKAFKSKQLEGLRKRLIRALAENA
ncbi:MAG: hypothetical protein PF495_12430 [Spirochaetales bacterium]|jgi:hypothetical protein|nr:hypothetical protein [Spirochaetales bacterium]